MSLAARHPVLLQNDAALTKKLETLQAAGQYAQVRQILRREYQRRHDISLAELLFLETIERLRTDGRIYLGTATQRLTEIHHVLEGFRWLRDCLDVTPAQLIDLGLLKQPVLDGEPRQRIAKRLFWSVTPGGRDLIDVAVVGPERGDMGEEIAHSIGVWLYQTLLTHAPAVYPDANVLPQRYWAGTDGIYDLCVQTRDPPETVAVAEVETGPLDRTHVTNDAHQLSHMPGKSIWITATRAQAAELVTMLANRGLVGIQRRHLPVTTHAIDEINRRIRIGGEPAWIPGQTPACTHVWSFNNLLEQVRAVEARVLASAPEASVETTEEALSVYSVPVTRGDQ